jgi:hypothetical protein
MRSLALLLLVLVATPTMAQVPSFDDSDADALLKDLMKVPRSCFITQFVTTCTPKKPGKTSLPGSQKQL